MDHKHQPDLRNRPMTLRANQILLPIPPLDAAEVRAATLVTLQHIIFRLTHRRVITAQDTARGTHFSFPRGDTVRTKQVIRLSRAHRESIVRNLVPIRITAITLQPKRVVFRFAANQELC